MTPSQLAVHLSTLCCLAPYFLQEDGRQGPNITPLSKRKLLLHMHPELWMSKFTDTGKTAATSTIPEIVAYMMTQYSNEVITRPKKKCKNSNGNDDSVSSSNCGRDSHGYCHCGHSGCFGNHLGGRLSGCGCSGCNGWGNYNRELMQLATHPDAPCALHNGQHKWCRCVFNPNADTDAPSLCS
jgi:hypothetical protein